MRPYSLWSAGGDSIERLSTPGGASGFFMAERCTLTASNPVLKPPMVSALDTRT